MNLLCPRITLSGLNTQSPILPYHARKDYIELWEMNAIALDFFFVRIVMESSIEYFRLSLVL